MKYHIEKNSVQETLIIPLFGRLICSERYPDLFSDPSAARICGNLDYDFSEKRRLMESQAGLFGALEVAQRQYDLMWEVQDYLKTHPRAAVVNLGCGLDDTFSRVDNGQCLGYNLDMPDVISVRNELLPAAGRERNIGCDLNEHSWMDQIDAAGGAVFFASGVFYYFETEAVMALFRAMAALFPGAVLAFDCCNRRGARMMTKTWLKGAGIREVNALFSLDDPGILRDWSENFTSVTARSYMRGYRDIYPRVNGFHRLMIRLCDSFVRMVIVKITFGEGGEHGLSALSGRQRL